MEGKYYKKKNDKVVQCNLCPHNCIIYDGQFGICKVRKNISGRIETLNYGKISSFAYDPIEKKPLYHFYPGSKIFSIGSFGCNFKCDFCQNWSIAQRSAETVEIKDEDLMLLAKSKGSIGIAYTYNEPVVFYEYVYHICRIAKANGLKNVLVTNGYINPEALEDLLPYIDAMNIDLKSIKGDYYKNICKGKMEPVMNTIEMASKHTHVEITNLVVEGLNSSLAEIDKLSSWIASIDESIPLHLTKYYPAYKMKLPETSYGTLVKAKKVAEKYLNYVYIGNVIGVDNNTYCPNCSNKLVDRYITGKVTGIINNKCSKCGYEVNILVSVK